MQKQQIYEHRARQKQAAIAPSLAEQLETFSEAQLHQVAGTSDDHFFLVQQEFLRREYNREGRSSFNEINIKCLNALVGRQECKCAV